jgi:hypothetical protein
MLDLAVGISDPDLLDPAQADQWPQERWVPADAIRATLLRSDLNPDPHGLRINGARVTGQLHLEHAKIACPFGLFSSRLDDVAHLNYAQLPELWLVGTRTRGLNLDGIIVSGDAYLNELRATGEVRAFGAHITGHLGLIGATITNIGGRALNLDGIHLEGSAYLQRFSAIGEVRAIGARINGAFQLMQATLFNKDGIALGMDGANLGGAVSMAGLTAIGELRAVGAQIPGQLTLIRATLDNGGGDALTLVGIQVTELLLRDVTAVRGLVNLTAAQVGDLEWEEPAEGLAPLLATGWQLRDIHGVIRTDRQVAARWLDTRPKEEGFAAQPWHELAAVYERNGQPTDARWLRWKAARNTTKHAPWWSRPGRWAYGALVGHGYYPLLSAAWLVVALLGAAVLTGLNQDAFTPTDPTAAVEAVQANTPAKTNHDSVTGTTDCDALTPGYPCFDYGLYALNTVVPPAAAVQTPAWAPTDPDKEWLPWALNGLRAAGWIFTVLLLAGVTGLLRKT